MYFEYLICVRHCASSEHLKIIIINGYCLSLERLGKNIQKTRKKTFDRVPGAREIVLSEVRGCETMRGLKVGEAFNKAESEQGFNRMSGI